MWIFSKHGFFSVVESKHPDLLVVRARVRRDLENLLKSYPRLVSPAITFSRKTDYPYRVRLPKIVVAEIVQQAVMDINYTNFKQSLMDRDCLGCRSKAPYPTNHNYETHFRHDVYADVWANVSQLEPLNDDEDLAQRMGVCA